MRHIRDQAKAFAIAAERCNEERPSGPDKIEWLPFPAITLWAFSIELGIKALLATEEKAAHGHNLEKLFCELSPETQGQLRNRWREISGQPVLCFDSSLRECANDFKRFRYLYEIMNKPLQFDVQIPFLQSLSKATLSLLD